MIAALVAFAALQATGAQILIADGAKTAPEAQKKLAALKLPDTVRFAEGFPRVIASESVAGLNPGLQIIVLGFCPAEDTGRTEELPTIHVRQTVR